LKALLTSQCSKKPEGFIFSVDAVFAVILVTAAILALNLNFSKQSFSFFPLRQSADDVFSTLQDTGFLFQQADNNSLQNAALSFYSKAKALLPSGSKLQVRLSQYNLNKEACRNFKDFEHCFSIAGSSIAGDSSLPDDIAFGKRLIVKKQSPGDCNVSAELSGALFPKPLGKALFSEAFFQSTGGDLNIGIQPYYNGLPLANNSSIQCDENVRIDLNAYFPTTGRPPLNIIFGADKSKSTGECVIAKGSILYSSSGSTTSSFQKVFDFSLSDNNAFDVLVEWQNTCSVDCPVFFVKGPNDLNYGFGFANTTDQNASSCNVGDVLNSKAYYLNKSTFAYLALNSNVANSKAGIWQVWLKKPGSALNYSLTVKKIQNNYFDSSSLIIKPWNNPISKIELAQVFIARFNENALWDRLADEYAYAEIGNDKKGSGDNSAIQPSSGLRPIGDQAFKSQLKNLSAISTDFSAFGFALSGNSMIDEELAKQPSIEIRTVILFGDADSNGMPSAIAGANDARDKNIVVFTVGFGRDYNFTDLKAIAAITKGEYFNAQDENALQFVFDLIAQKIFNLSGFAKGIGVTDLNINIPIISGSVISNPTTNFQGTYLLSNDFLRFFVHDINILSPWRGSYIINFPCSLACSNERKFFPEFGTNYSYVDSNGSSFSNSLDINKYFDVNFLYRDLVVSFENAELIDINHVGITARLSNIGDLNTLNYSSGLTGLNFYANSVFEGSKTITGLCSSKSSSCSRSFDLNGMEIFQEGIFDVSIDSNAVRDCPLGNTARVVCRSELVTEFYVLEYGVWN
jgi:hypothetical protein